MNTEKFFGRTVAFYLPQFHAIPENDEWWGEGFTEWTNVSRAEPLFKGHDHPRVTRELGNYDLRDVDVMRAQTEMAQDNGIDAFCFYFYWFSGKRLLEAPLNNFLDSSIDFPYCISWANENWSRRWDGKDSEILIGQNYEEGFADRVFESFLPHLKDPRYLRQGPAAIIMVHRVDHIPDSVLMAHRWRQLAQQHGVGELYLVAAETRPGIDPRTYGFDAVSEFPPVGTNSIGSAQLRPVRALDRHFAGRLMSYPRMVRRFQRRAQPEFVRHHGVAPGWDNTARRGRKATVYVGASPQLYSEWLQTARNRENALRGPLGIVFVNAWNEWAEGAYLEPDASNGSAYLDATRHPSNVGPFVVKRPDFGWPTLGWVRSLGVSLAGSLLNWSRQARPRSRKRNPRRATT